MAELRVARSELILGGEKSGKTARAESLAAAWLAAAPGHRAVYVATARAWDEEMREHIARQQRERAERVPRMTTVEEPLELAHAIGQHSRSDTLVVVDCLTLWLTARLLPAAGLGRSPHPNPPPEGEGMTDSPHPNPLPEGEGMNGGGERVSARGDATRADGCGSLSLWERAGVRAPLSTLSTALSACAGPIVLVSNETGLEAIPIGRDGRAFIDALAGLNQAAAAACERVTLMSAGVPLMLKGSA